MLFGNDIKKLLKAVKYFFSEQDEDLSHLQVTIEESEQGNEQEVVTTESMCSAGCFG